MTATEGAPGTGVGVRVGVELAVYVRVAVRVAVRVGVREGVLVGVRVAVRVGVRVALGVDVGVRLGVRVGVRLAVAVGVRLGVRVGRARRTRCRRGGAARRTGRSPARRRRRCPTRRAGRGSRQRRRRRRPAREHGVVSRRVGRRRNVVGPGAAVGPRDPVVCRTAGGLWRWGADLALDSFDAQDVCRSREGLAVERDLKAHRTARQGQRCRPRQDVDVFLDHQPGRIRHEEMDPVPDVGRRFSHRWNRDRAAGRARRRRQERMDVGSVVKIHPPGERASRQRPGLRVGGRTRVVDDGAAGVGRPGSRLRDRRRRRLVRRHRESGLGARGVTGPVRNDAAELIPVVAGPHGGDRVGRKRRQTDVDVVALPLIRERRLPGGGDGECHRVARRDQLALGVPGDRRRVAAGVGDLVDLPLVARDVIEVPVEIRVHVDRARDPGGEERRRRRSGGRIERLDVPAAVVGEKVPADVARRELGDVGIVEVSSGDRAAAAVRVVVEGVRELRVTARCRGALKERTLADVPTVVVSAERAR